MTRTATAARTAADIIEYHLGRADALETSAAECLADADALSRAGGRDNAAAAADLRANGLRLADRAAMHRTLAGQ